MTNILLSGESIDKTKEADTFAFLTIDVIIPEGMKRVDVVDCLAASGIYSSEDDLAYGSDESDSRNERMVLKAVGHLGHSDHKYNLPALAQLAAAWPASRTVPIDLDETGAYSFKEGGQLMANASVLPFGLRWCAVGRSCIRCRNQLDLKHVHGWAYGSVHTQPALPHGRQDC